MKAFVSLAAVLVAIPQATAHYTFTKLIANGAVTNPFQYVRQNNNSNSPITNIQSNDMRCNSGASSGAGTSTATVAAGSTVGMALDQSIFHAGVLNVYLSKVSNAASADGSDPWFKIYQISAVTNGGSSISWPTDNASQFTWKLPSSIQAGQYLMRVEHIALHSASTNGGAQFYISCAQLNITGGGSASPSGVSIPGVYQANDPGIVINIYFPIPASYQQPGPPVFVDGSNGNGNGSTAQSSSTQPTSSSTRPSSSIVPTSTSRSSSANTGNCAELYGQCGGQGWAGATCCKTGTCVSSGQFYSQCLNR